MTDRQAARRLNRLIAQCRARKMADRYEDYPDDGASAADDEHQRRKEEEC